MNDWKEQLREDAIKSATAWETKLREDWTKTTATPEFQALEKLEAGMRMLRADPAIAVSEPCTEILDALIELLERAWPRHSAQEILSPLHAHFDSEKGKNASAKKKEKRDEDNIRYYQFLDEQKTLQTPRDWQGALEKVFAIERERGSEDTVRRWKKLRATGKT